MCPEEVLGSLLHGRHIQVLCLQSPAYILFKHRQLIRPGAACGQTILVGPGGGCVSSVEVVGHSEGLQYTNGRVLQVGVEGLGHDLRGERRLPWAALDVQVRRVAQGMHPGIGAARDGEPDRVDRVQPLGSLLREPYRRLPHRWPESVE